MLLQPSEANKVLLELRQESTAKRKWSKMKWGKVAAKAHLVLKRMHANLSVLSLECFVIVTCLCRMSAKNCLLV